MKSSNIVGGSVAVCLCFFTVQLLLAHEARAPQQGAAQRLLNHRVAASQVRAVNGASVTLRPKRSPLPRDPHKERCDALCEQYDKTRNADICATLRTECHLPCDVHQQHMDVVFLWANGTDPVYEDYVNALKRKLASDPDWNNLRMNCMKTALEVKRSRELGTFRYAMRSLFDKYDFVRRVFIVSPLGQVPSWVNLSHPLIRIIDTRELLPNREVSFNSNSIQFHMHEIPTLSDPFLTMNDDFLVLKNSSYSDFVLPNGLVFHNLDYYHASGMEGCWGEMVKASVKLSRDLTGDNKDRNVAAHTPLAVSKAAARFIMSRFYDKISSVTSHVLRHPDDLTFDSFHIWISGDARFSEFESIPFECRGTFGMDHQTHFDQVVTMLVSPPPCKSLALNDDFDEEPNPMLLRNVNAFLETMYPDPSPVELIAPGASAHAQPEALKLHYTCRSSGAAWELTGDTFLMPSPVLAKLHTHESTRYAAGHDNKLSYKDAARSFPTLNVVDVVNCAECKAPKSLVGRPIRAAVAVPSSGGRYWCEIASAFRERSMMENDFVFAPRMDLGMGRSRNIYAARRLALAMNFGFAFAPEFYELTMGTPQEKDELENHRVQNIWGMSGHAILTKWPIVSTSVVSFTEKEDYFRGTPEREGEMRIGQKSALVSVVDADHERVVLISLAVSLKNRNEKELGDEIVDKLSKHLNATGGVRRVLLGGTVWPSVCDRLGLKRLFTDAVGAVSVKDNKVEVSTTQTFYDVLCGTGFDTDKPAVVAPCQFKEGNGKNVACSDHQFIDVGLKWK